MNGKGGAPGSLRLADAGLAARPSRYRARGEIVADALGGAIICMAWSAEKAEMVAEALNLRERAQDAVSPAPEPVNIRGGERHYVPANPPVVLPIAPVAAERDRKRKK